MMVSLMLVLLFGKQTSVLGRSHSAAKQAEMENFGVEVRLVADAATAKTPASCAGGLTVQARRPKEMALM